MHPAAPAWVTVNVRVAIVIVAERAAVAVFAVAPKVTVPLPVPLAPEVTVSQPAGLLALHAHPVGAVTDTEPLAAAAGSDALAADNVGAQVGVKEN